MGLNTTLNVAKTALAAQQIALEVTGHNIANVNNENYSRQIVSQSAMQPQNMGSYFLGRGVDVVQIQQSVDQFIENNLMSYKSDLAFAEKTAVHLTTLESYLNENTENGLSKLYSELWSAWQDLSNKPNDVSQRAAVYSASKKLSEQFQAINQGITTIKTDINNSLSNMVVEVNRLTSEIASLNGEIASAYLRTNANDLRDKRMALLKDLSKLVGTNVLVDTKDNANVSLQNGSFPIVNQTSSFQLVIEDNKIIWKGRDMQSDVSTSIITGEMGALQTLASKVLPNYENKINTLARETIWTVNKQHSLGVGLSYFTKNINGTYKTDSSGKFSSLTFANKIDYTKDLKIWTKTLNSAGDIYKPITMDMDISTAKVSNFKTSGPYMERSRFEFTVVESGQVGEFYRVNGISSNFRTPSSAEIEANKTSNTPNFNGIAKSGASEGEILNSILADQKISVVDGAGKKSVIAIPDLYNDPNVEKSAKSIVSALNKITGVSATAASHSVDLNIKNLWDTQNYGDNISFKFIVGGIETNVNFTIENSVDQTITNFKNSLDNSINTILSKGVNISANYDKIQSDGIITLSNSAGDNITVADFKATDNVVGTFGGNYTTNNWNLSNNVEFSIKYGSSSHFVKVYVPDTLPAGKTQDTMIADLIAEKLGIKSGEKSVTLADTAGSLTITRNGDSFNYVATGGIEVEFANLIDELDTTNPAKLNITCSNGSQINATSGLNSFLLDSAVLSNKATINPNNNAFTMSFGDKTITEDSTSDSAVKFSTLSIGLQENMIIYSDATTNSLFSSAPMGGAELVKETFVSPAKIAWASFGVDGTYTGKTGEFTVAKPGTQTIACGNGSTFSLDINYGKLVAGNSFSVNTDLKGSPIDLQMYTLGKSSFVDNNYTFKILNEGYLGRDTIKIEWKDNYRNGILYVPSSPSQLEQVTIDFDGMKININKAQMYAGDTFNIKTDDTGAPTITRSQDWQWTFQSFQRQFNNLTKAAGINLKVGYAEDETMGFMLQDAITSFAFDGSEGYNSGVLAALGINTFFQGLGATDINLNNVVNNYDNIAAGAIYADGSIGVGNGANAISIVKNSENPQKVTRWGFDSNGNMFSTVTNLTLSDYYFAITTELGATATKNNEQMSFKETLFTNLTARRNEISGVSTDEEMIKLIEYQHAWTAASKIVTAIDEMLQALLAMR